MDNEIQFTKKGYGEFLKQLDISNLASLVEHPQTNGQAEVTNKVILVELHKRLSKVPKGLWVDKLPSMLWGYHCTPQSTTQDTPSRLTYGTKAMVPVEIDEPSLRRRTFNTVNNSKSLVVERDLAEEVRSEVRTYEEACKRKMTQKYNSKLKKQGFKDNNLVWRLKGNARKDNSEGKLVPS